jgi:hypothetical protein
MLKKIKIDLNKKTKHFSLLDSFICRRFNAYKEPQRKGVPKGEKIGVSPKKYLAALLSLKNLKQKYIAEIANSTHNSVRKWNTEDDFLDLTDNFKTEYAEYVIKHLKKRSKRQLELRDEYFALSPLEMIDTPPTLLSLSEFYDLNQYEFWTLVRTFHKLIKVMEDLGKKAVLLVGPEQDVALSYQCSDILSLISPFTLKKSKGVKESRCVEVIPTEALKRNQFTAIRIILGHELKTKGQMSEDTLKKTIWLMHREADSYNEIDMEVPLKGVKIE